MEDPPAIAVAISAALSWAVLVDRLESFKYSLTRSRRSTPASQYEIAPSATLGRIRRNAKTLSAYSLSCAEATTPESSRSMRLRAVSLSATVTSRPT